MKRWYVVQLRYNMEDVAEDNLENQGFVTYNPVMLVDRPYRGQTVQVEEPLFRGYLFVQFDLKQDNWRRVCSTKGVHKLLTATEDTCMPLPNGFIEDLQRKEDTHGYIALPGMVKVLRDYVIGEELRVEDGVFKGFTGIVQRIQKGRVFILLSLLNGRAAVELTKEQVSRFTHNE